MVAEATVSPMAACKSLSFSAEGTLAEGERSSSLRKGPSTKTTSAAPSRAKPTVRGRYPGRCRPDSVAPGRRWDGGVSLADDIVARSLVLMASVTWGYLGGSAMFHRCAGDG
jgi:hypothetical protein